MPARNLEEVYDFFQNEPIEIDKFDDLYVNADKGRGGKPSYNRLKQRLVSKPDGSLKMLFAGFRGCGKSTELVRLQRAIEKDFVILNFSVLKSLDILNISYTELFIATMERLFDFVKKEQIEIDPLFLTNIKNWLNTREIEEIVQRHLGADIQSGIKGEVTIPFLAGFFAKFTAAAKSSSSIKETLKTTVEPKISEFILNCNLLIDEIKSKLPDIGKKGLIIIIEDLDKVDVERGEDIFYIHSTQLTQLGCHCIFTFPIALLYHNRFKTIKNNYDEAFVLPMIKVSEKSGEPCNEGIRIMMDIIKQRMDPPLFENRVIPNQMIRYSGGCLWDLFRMIKDAADEALDFERAVINSEDYDAAYRSLKAEYEFTIAENKEKDITVEDY
ncbi:hypothetical protein QUF80_23935 [Desulfococcaceae bacterium HSG8]|nr:hypothetical protein [Desulfococcaceae bacterium HSG8]